MRWPKRPASRWPGAQDVGAPCHVDEIGRGQGYPWLTEENMLKAILEAKRQLPDEGRDELGLWSDLGLPKRRPRRQLLGAARDKRRVHAAICIRTRPVSRARRAVEHVDRNLRGGVALRGQFAVVVCRRGHLRVGCTSHQLVRRLEAHVARLIETRRLRPALQRPSGLHVAIDDIWQCERHFDFVGRSAGLRLPDTAYLR